MGIVPVSRPLPVVCGPLELVSGVFGGEELVCWGRSALPLQSETKKNKEAKFPLIWCR